MIYPEQGAVRTKFLSIGDKLSARFDNISLLASGKTTIGGASLEVQRDGKGYSGNTSGIYGSFRWKCINISQQEDGR